MGVRVYRVALAAAGLVWLAGCETTSNPGNPFRELGDTFGVSSSAPGDDVTGSIRPPPGSPPGTPPLAPELLGSDPNDDVSVGKKYFRQGSFGLAERHFRRAVELHPRDAEAWVGLAASYDRLKRFDLADRAYTQAIRILGPTPEILNNQGFSYILRGDYSRARNALRAAQSKDPENPYIQNNLRLLDESARTA
jgi:tetratricopeptide (TPR) repeat protein